MIKKIANKVVWLVVFLLTIGIIVWANIEHSNMACNNINVIMKTTNYPSLTSTDIIKSGVIESMPALLGQSIKNINIEELESYLATNSHLSKTKTFIGLNGNIWINTIPREAILRIFDEKGVNSYIGNNRVLMKNSRSHSQRIMVASGHIKAISHKDQELILRSEKALPKMHNELYEMALYIKNDHFLNALIDQIYVQKNQELELTPKVGVKQIFFGKAENIEEKLEDLKTFYINGNDKIDWQKYQSINLKYKNQIVCSKK
ncbi:MAG: hypothetical protein KAH25_07900 [Bacteroidales bacterium]|nr:hypothetical protein [Bacteroidales bacterium]